MKKRLGVLVVLFMIFGLSFSVFASWKSDLKKAKEFVVIENYKLADKLIQDAILENPTKAELQYQAGVIYYDMGWNRQSAKAFRIAVKLDNDKKTKSAHFTKRKGFLFFKKRTLIPLIF